VSYQDSGGKGAVVLFLHPYNRLMWGKQIPAVTRAGYRFVSMDFRDLVVGPPVGTTSPSLVRIDELIALLGVSKVQLVGTGGTGGLTLQYALVHPDKVRTVIAGNSLVGLRDDDLNPVERRLRSPQFDAMPAAWRELSPTYRATDVEGVERWQELAAARPVTAPAATAAPTATTTPNPANPNAVTVERLNQLKVPFLFFCGDADQYTPPGIMRMFLARVKKVQGVAIPDSGHNSQWENPDAFNRTLMQFIGRH
jgi:pimeloyl-ACP methyl ester carboxylesterase